MLPSRSVCSFNIDLRIPLEGTSGLNETWYWYRWKFVVRFSLNKFDINCILVPVVPKETQNQPNFCIIITDKLLLMRVHKWHDEVLKNKKPVRIMQSTGNTQQYHAFISKAFTKPVWQLPGRRQFYLHLPTAHTQYKIQFSQYDIICVVKSNTATTKLESQGVSRHFWLTIQTRKNFRQIAHSGIHSHQNRLLNPNFRLVEPYDS